MYYSVSWQSHVWHKYRVANPVFLSDVLNDVIGVTSNCTYCRPCSIQLPYVILPRLRFTTGVFSKAENWDDFMIHRVDENWSLVLVSVYIYFTVLSTLYDCVLQWGLRSSLYVGLGLGGESTLDLVLRKYWGNSGVAASTSRHWEPQESSMWRWFHNAGQCNTGHGVALPGCGGGLGLGGRPCWLSVSLCW